jgi:ATP-binding cassette, subfamily B, bacterial
MARSPHWQLLTQLLRPHRRVMLALGAVLAVSSALPLAGPQLLRAFIDQAEAGEALAALVAIAGVYVALGVTAQAANVGTAYLATRVAWSATNALRERTARHALSLDLSFHGATSPGTLVERTDGDATAITRFFTDVVIKATSAALTLAGTVLLVTREDWRVGAAMALFMAVAVYVIAKLRDRAVPATSAERAAYADVIGLVEEQLDGSEDLRALGAGPYALDRHTHRSALLLRAALKAEGETAKVWMALMGFFAVGGASMLVTGWWLHRAGTITIGTVFLLFSYTQVVRRPVEVLAEQLQEVQRAGAGASRIRQLLEERPAVGVSGSMTLPQGALSVRFDRVSFTYPDEAADAGRHVLSGIDVRVAPGEVVGLVGHTGSGKTTMARLALRLVDPTEGAVVLGGVDLRTARTDDLRRRVAVVTQDVQLFAASVRDNLTLFGTAEASDDELHRLLGELGLGEWVRDLPRGLDTAVQPPGGMSAGQAQLLGLARAFLRDPGLVVLDEASSRTDPVTAERIESALDRLLADRTALVIAHRLRAVDRADRIVVLDHGRVVEEGRRAALAADPTSVFARMVEMEKTATGTTTQEPR